eukprot:scaffold2071_cov190-Alexandrium_tamarense.AAC.9
MSAIVDATPSSMNDVVDVMARNVDDVLVVAMPMKGQTTSMTGWCHAGIGDVRRGVEDAAVHITLDTIAAPSGRVHHIFQNGSSDAAVGIDEDVKRVIDEAWSLFGTVDV